jgi:hypothetical protein
MLDKTSGYDRFQINVDLVIVSYIMFPFIRIF